jgi:hypothetical protein
VQPVTWVGRWKFLDGWTKVWSCERGTLTSWWVREGVGRPAFTPEGLPSPPVT